MAARVQSTCPLVLGRATPLRVVRRVRVVCKGGSSKQQSGVQLHRCSKAGPVQLAARPTVAAQRRGVAPLFATEEGGEGNAASTAAAATTTTTSSSSDTETEGTDTPAASSSNPAGQPVASDDAYDGAGYGDHSPANTLGTFSFVENRRTVNTNYQYMDLPTIKSNINERKSKVFLLLEEVRRLKIQERKRRVSAGMPLVDLEDEEFSPQQSSFRSAIPLLPDLSEAKVTDYYRFYAGAVAFLIVMGGLVAPTAELYIGLNGTSYAAFIDAMHLPSQLAQVDPIVASFTGGAGGVLSALMAVEINNVKKQIAQRCPYCEGSGYLSCMSCDASGAVTVKAEAADGTITTESRECETCSGTGKVLCVSCLGTGMIFATEHDIRLDPFSAE